MAQPGRHCHRSDGPRNCRNNAGLLAAAKHVVRVTMA